MAETDNSIHNFAVEATDFASDDYIAIDGTTNGSRKMKNDSLLKVTAQNALAGNVAPAFVPSDKPNPTTTIAGYPYVYNGSLYVAKEDYTGAWDSSKFEKTECTNLFPKDKIIDRGKASVSEVNLSEERQDGWCYVLTDSGFVNYGETLVNAGESVVWDATNLVWIVVKPDLNVGGNEDVDFAVADDKGNVIMKVEGGFLKTENFDSELAVKEVSVESDVLILDF